MVDETKPLELFDPVSTWKRKTVTNYRAEALQIPVFQSGKCVYESPKVKEIQDYCRKQVDALWDEVKRFENPHRYYVDLSPSLWELKNRMLKNTGRLD